MDLNIRQLNLADLNNAMRLSEAEGWNQTEKDWRMVLTNPDDICIGADYGGRIVGTSNAVVYEGKIAWIGMVLVERGLRRQGIGRRLFDSILGKVSGLRSVKLDATPAGQPLYEKFGFSEEYMIDRMINMNLADFDINYRADVKPVSEKDLPFILQDDRKIFGTDRSFIIRNLFKDYPEKAFSIDDSFILGRSGKIFHYAGPLYSSSPEHAYALTGHVLKQLVGQPVALDVPQSKKEFRRWLESIGFTKQRHFTRMYFNSNEFRGMPEQQYLILGPEFG
ncbi:MAG TPA: GNAT family N-acetyltransferase [Bacteroidales bacterium]|nr:GNAT family N-acetyltransferase [Bacteroidales bacterium]